MTRFYAIEHRSATDIEANYQSEAIEFWLDRELARKRAAWLNENRAGIFFVRAEFERPGVYQDNIVAGDRVICLCPDPDLGDGELTVGEIWARNGSISLVFNIQGEPIGHPVEWFRKVRDGWRLRPDKHGR